MPHCGIELNSMNLRTIKLFAGAFVLLTYMSLGIFGLFNFAHTDEMSMPDCPYAQGGSAICQNNLDHINNWQQFSNAVFPALFALFLILGMIWYYFNVKLITEPKYFYKWKCYLNSEKLYTYQEEITKWLSLFENSPSFSYVRHS